MTLNLLNRESFYRESALSNAIVEAVNAGLAPWKPGRITLYLQQHIDTFDRIMVETELLGKLPFIYQLNPFDMISFEPELMAAMVAETAFLFYRNRPALPVDDHIILGEE